MKNLIIVSSLVTGFILFSACSSNQVKEDRSPASTLSQYLVPNVSLQLQKTTIEYCGKTFDVVDVASSHPGIRIYHKLVSHPKLAFPYPVPAAVGVTHPSTAAVFAKASAADIGLVVDQVQLTNPIFPSIPILSDGKERDVCPQLVAYHQQFQSMSSANKIKSSKMMNLNTGVASINLPELRSQIVAEAIRVQNETNALVSNKQDHDGRSTAVDFIIFYDDQYEADVTKLRNAHTKIGYHPLMIKISQLPGYRAQDPVPAECAGDFMAECYHVYGAKAVGLSQGAVAATKGMVNNFPISQKTYSKIPYVPGLIRAAMRSYKKHYHLKGVMLVGNPDKIPGIYTKVDGYASFPWSSNPDENDFNKLHTDLYYMLPDLALTPTGMFSHEMNSPLYWMCEDKTGKRTFRVWCNSDEVRAYPDPPLAVLKWPSYVPNSRVLEIKNNDCSSSSSAPIATGTGTGVGTGSGSITTTTTTTTTTTATSCSGTAAVLNDQNLKKITLKDIIPVGRIVTHEDLTGIHDQIVSNYADKMLRWDRELPEMTGNSIESNGGSTSDDWIFLEEDLTQFRATYGTSSSIYASEFFLPLSKCLGLCQYKTGELIHQELRQKNRVAFVINGHGGYIGVQAPFANGNIGSGYSSDHTWGRNGYQQLLRIEYPENNTVKVLENGGLIGHIIANSCDLSNFDLYGSANRILLNMDPTTNIRSLGEQWLGVVNGGALNVYTNSDVGWGYSDNNYDVKFMNKVAQAQAQCGTIGDALKLTVYDMIQGNQGGAGDWQVINRQFLGSPVNRIAKLPANCVSAGGIAQ